jgi:hypothetical protein
MMSQAIRCSLVCKSHVFSLATCRLINTVVVAMSVYSKYNNCLGKNFSCVVNFLHLCSSYVIGRIYLNGGSPFVLMFCVCM